MRDNEIVGLWEAYLQVHQPKEEVEKLDEISKELAGRVVNARIARTGRAFDREMKDRTPENMRASMDAADKEGRAKRLAAGVRKRRNATNEEVENWVNSLIDEGYDLSEYTWDDMYEMYVTEADSIAAMRARAAKRRKQRYGASDTSRGGRDDFAPITDYEAANKKWERPTQKENVDLFDAILEHLVAEGYADTNENALVIMANMSEEWRESIVEAKYGTKEGRHKLAMKIKKGEEVGKSGPGTGFKEVEKKAKKYGASNPKAVAAAAMWKHYGK